MLKTLITTAADDILIYFYFSGKIWYDIPCESSAYQTSNMKNQALFSLRNNKINFRMSTSTNLLSVQRILVPDWFKAAVTCVRIDEIRSTDRTRKPNFKSSKTFI